MAHHQSTKKRIRQSEKRKMLNKYYARTTRGAIKKLRNTKDKKEAAELYGWAESNVNVLTDNQPPYNPEIGSNQLRGVLCKVYKVSASGPAPTVL